MTMPKPHNYADELPALNALTPETHPARDAEHFRRIIAARKALADAQTELVAAVHAARDAGDSWTVIGAALGTTRQGAFRKFGNSDGAEVVAILQRRAAKAKARPAKVARAVAMKATNATKATPAKGTPAKVTPAKVAKASPARSAATGQPEAASKGTAAKRGATKSRTGRFISGKR
jgi:hypothetical protein